MKVKLLTSLATASTAYNVGDEYECSAAEAGRLCEKGFAVPIAEQKIERAVKKQPAKETRSKR